MRETSLEGPEVGYGMETGGSGSNSTDRSKEPGRMLCVATSPKAVFSPPRGTWRPVLLGSSRSPWNSPQGKSTSATPPCRRSAKSRDSKGCSADRLAFASRAMIWQSFQAWLRFAKEIRCQKLELRCAKAKRSAAGRLMFRLSRAGGRLAEAKDHFQLSRVLSSWHGHVAIVQRMQRMQLCCRAFHGWRAILELRESSRVWCWGVELPDP